VLHLLRRRPSEEEGGARLRDRSGDSEKGSGSPVGSNFNANICSEDHAQSVA
jgi:hypothetical protein